MTNAANRPNSFERELIVIVKPEAGVRATRERVRSITAADTNPIAELLASENATMRPLFGLSEERMQARTAELDTESDADVLDLSIYYKIDAPDERLEEIASRLLEQEIVDGAYVKPAPEEPIAPALNEILNMGSATEFTPPPPLPPPPPPLPPPQSSPNFTTRQTYLDPAPTGINVKFASKIPGGRGRGVSVIDIERNWRFSHEDLIQNQGGIIGGTPVDELRPRNHGTAVIGVIGSDSNWYGCTGISPNAFVRAISHNGIGVAAAIRTAADALKSGDIILIEVHAAGPRFNFQRRRDQRGYIAMEWWPDVFAAIRYATQRGIITIEAAGNGAENLDDPIYNTPARGFPSSWSNPFNRANRDSGAILVGAGAPPPGTHERDHGPDRSRLDFSNYGSAVDAQGWGREVTTCGYGDLQGGDNEDEWYTDRFSGTSSASPIVVGAVACVQGILSAHNKNILAPTALRDLLRSTGSPQQDAPERPSSQRIGNRPDIREMVKKQFGLDSTTVVLYTERNYQGISQELEPGRYILEDLERTIGNKALSSMRIPEGMRVILYDFDIDSFERGKSKEFTEDTAYVGDDFNNQTSSLEILFK